MQLSFCSVDVSVDSGVKSSAYAKVLTPGGGEGRSEVYKLNRIGEYASLRYSCFD